MSTQLLADIDVDVLLNIIVSSDGDLSLVAERLCKKLSVEYGKVTEYDVKERIASLDVQTTDTISAKLRSLLAIKTYKLIHEVGDALANQLGDLKPSDLARAHSSLINSFSSLTQSATKVTFDFDREMMDLASDLGLPIEDMRGKFKEFEQKATAIKQSNR